MTPLLALADWRLPVNGPDAVELAASLGATGIQLDIGGPGRAPWLDEDNSLCRLRVAIERSNIAPLAVSANIINDIGLTSKLGTAPAEYVQDIILRLVDVAAKLKAPIVFIPSFKLSAISEICGLERTIEVLRWACVRAYDLGLVLASENVLPPDWLRELIDQVDQPNFRIMFDPANAAAAGIDPSLIIHAAGTALCDQVHIKSSDQFSLLSAHEFAITSTLEELRSVGARIKALVLENDYRSTTKNNGMQRILEDLAWLGSYTRNHPMASRHPDLIASHVRDLS